MNMNQGSLAVGTVIAVLAVMCVAASVQTSSTPLYTVRMEQISSEMNFLPTAVNGFTYTAEKGYTVNCEVSAYNGANLFNPLTIGTTCETCHDPTCVTCFHTCLPTCDDTTCRNTCGVSYCVCPTGAFC